MIHFARLRGDYDAASANFLIRMALYNGDAWNRLMALIYAN